MSGREAGPFPRGQVPEEDPVGQAGRSREDPAVRRERQGGGVWDRQLQGIFGSLGLEVHKVTSGPNPPSARCRPSGEKARVQACPR